jgi:UDPglucose 6-dehydrogenase
MAEIYRPLVAAGAPLQVTSRRSAELIKYAANAFLAVKISFINEIADLAERAGADIEEVARGIGADHRIGMHYLRAGAGFGGSCLPKDTAALARTAEELGRPVRLVEAARAVNAMRTDRMLAKIVDACGGVGGKRIGILGLSFAPNTDDLREAPSLGIIAGLSAQGATIAACDPAAGHAARILLPDIEFRDTAYDVARDADALVLITEWNAFRALDLPRLKATMRTPVFIDLRNVYSGAAMAAAGLTYRSVGRPSEDVN